MALTRQTQRKFRAVCFYIFLWMLVALGLASLQMYRDAGFISIERLLLMLQFSLFIGLSHGIYDVIVLNDETDSRGIFKALLIRSSYFLIAILASISLCILQLYQKEGMDLISENSLSALKDTFSNRNTQVQIILYFLAAYLITFIRSVLKKFGKRVFWNTILGKTQEPKEEQLIFMYIDLRHSTSIAEELGHVNYSKFLKDYYRYVSNCCEENRGQIYQIAGDGAILTWTIKSCRKKAKPIDCFYDLKECLKKVAPKFFKKYGVTPSFKVGAHCGTVISTEVGNFGSEMAYHGDPLNTTARIQSLCAKLGQDFLISEELYNILPKPISHDFFAKKEGFFELKGKKSQILIFSLQKPLTV